ncbi:hypothetical protein BDV36DRAFT_245424 [Aspergillus pseudocaelatus]|uniref:6-phosphogluconate dehydrogenase NADP-binding domain-containing protein n=1 Tax=Aspergillus pseudocaelatus TaxID=1825620 RepID=A0ABQ6WZR1_9EURO|nr:hypothetical protein BDV36DRAFT_245424 [Aspergillus pseudocaelatus]
MTAERSVSILGLGQMGSALARAYVRAGWKAIVWNRSAAKAESLVAEGAIAVKSITECVSASRLVITCLLDHKALHEIFANVSPHPDDGAVLVDFTSGTAAQIQETQRMIKDLHISAYIRGIVCTTPAYVGTPETSLYYSGNSEAFKAISDDIRVLGKPLYIGDDPSSASIQECILVNTLFGLVAGFLQSMAVLRKSNLYSHGGAERFLSEAIAPLLAHDYPCMLRDYARQIDKKQYGSTEGARLGLVVHSLESLMQHHSELGLASVVLAPLQELVKTRIAQGGADEELSSLVETISDSQKKH